MKNTRFLLGVILLCAILGCRKNLNEIPFNSESNEDIQFHEMTENLSLLGAEAIFASDWQSNKEWRKLELPTHTVYSTHLKTTLVDNPGQQMIRVFKTLQGEYAPQSLPFEETIDGTRYYWYYTITKGDLMIAVDVYGASISPGLNHLFKTVVFTSETSSFKDEVKSRLSKLSYDKIDAFLKK